MKISSYRSSLEDFFRSTSVGVHEPTLLGHARDELYEMAVCYRNDGDRFLAQEDPVNALASFAYAAGWIDTGNYLGLFPCGSPCRSLFLEENEIPGSLDSRLGEKTLRYEQLLSRACSSCLPAAEPGIAWYDGGNRVIFIARMYLLGGQFFLKTGHYSNALASFSYGHGWLDASLRVGLITIITDREIFAV